MRFLENILNELRRAGLVVSHRGNAGGYTLAVPPEEMAVAQVIEAAQGPLSVAAPPNPDRRLPGDAAFERLWEAFDESMARVCRETSIADLVRWESQSQQQYVPDYVI